MPKGIQGHFGPGERKDQINLIERAEELGYTVIYDLKNFEKIKSHPKILGVFAHDDTYNDDGLIDDNNLYQKDAPTIAQMAQTALEFLQQKKQKFLLIAEEEGTDNFSNRKNIKGFLTAGKRADKALGAAFDFLNKHPDTLLLTTSDSNAGGLVITEASDDQTKPVFYTYPQTAYDFNKPPHKKGMTFSIGWGSGGLDSHGGIVVKAHGLNAHHVKGLMDNTQIYDLMYMTLFGRNISSSK